MNTRESRPAAHTMKTVPQPTRENRRATQNPAPIRHNARPDDPAEDKKYASGREAQLESGCARSSADPISAKRGHTRHRSTPKISCQCRMRS